MKKVLLTAATALAVFGSASVLANGRADNAPIKVTDQQTDENGNRLKNTEKPATPPYVAEYDEAKRYEGKYVEHNGENEATLAEAELANSDRLKQQSIDKTLAGAKAAKDGKDGKKVLPNTGAVK